MSVNGSTNPSEHESDSSAPEAFDRLLKQVAELREYVTYFVSAKTDSARLLVQQVLMWVALGLVGVIAICSVVATVVVLLLTGLAEGLTVVFDGRVWLGNIVAGLLTLAILGLGSFIWVRKWRKNSHTRTVQRYEQQQLEQQAAFGRSVSQRAADLQR
jgi:H+/Cl- antiporter ClcA